MARKKVVTQKPLELTMLDDCLTRFATIGKRQPLPTQHFYVEASEIIKEAVAKAYAAGLVDGEKGTETFPIADYK